MKFQPTFGFWMLVGDSERLIMFVACCGSLVWTSYTPGASNIAIAGTWGPRIESMYFLLNMGNIPASYVMVYQRVSSCIMQPSSSTILIANYNQNVYHSN